MIDFYAPGDGTLRANGRELHIKGANWFGTEGQHAVLYGLEKRSLDDLLAFLAANGFNALRLLFNHEHVDSDPPTPAYDLRGGRNFNPWLNPELLDTTYLEMLQVIVSKAAEHGILVLLACHRIRAFYNDLPGEKSVHSEWPGDWDGLWYDPEWSEARVLKNWAKLSDAFCGAWNVLGADLMNEPHGGGWGRGGAQMDWRLGAQRLGNGVLRSCPRWLMLVEGVGYPGVGAVGDGGPEGMYQWGEDLVGARKYPLKMSNQTKVVYSPHVYGPAIYEKIPEFEPELFKDRNFPRNMPDVWSKHFGFVPQATGQPLLVGETGGTLRGRDRQWAQTVIDWYLHNKIAGIFWYALNPNSDDTGGLLRADWETPEKEKLALLARMPATQISSLHELVPSIRIKSTPSPPPPAPKPPPPPPRSFIVTRPRESAGDAARTALADGPRKAARTELDKTRSIDMNCAPAIAPARQRRGSRRPRSP